MSRGALASTLILLLLSAGALALWRFTPQAARSAAGRITVLVIAVTGLTVAAITAWTAPQPSGLGQLAVALAVIVAAVTAGGPVSVTVLRLADPGTRSGPGPADPTVLHGGAWVGGLERLAICVSLMYGWPEGVALTLAIKGLGRYPELRSPGAAERFIIGTFTSVLWACGCAAIGVELLT